MARGMVVGEPINGRAQTKEFDSGWDQMQHEDDGQRGRFVWDEQARKLVPLADYRPPSRALDAPVIADRIHEGTVFDDGERVRDIGSRRKRREFMREKGWEDANDASREWREAQVKDRERTDDRKRHEAMEQAKRVLYRQGRWR